MSKNLLRLALLSVFLLMASWIVGNNTLSAAPEGLNFNVNDTTDLVDKKPGDGVCATKNKTCTLRAAVMEANAHSGTDIIKLQSNTTYVLTRLGQDDDAKKGDLDIRESVQIIGNGATIDANGAVTNDRAFHFFLPKKRAEYSLLKELTIQGGKTAGDGGGISNHAILYLLKVTVASNHADGQGGGIFNDLFVVSQDSTIHDNDCTCSTDENPGGGGIANRMYLAMLSSTINNNTSLRDGGGIWSVGDQLTLYASTVTLNRANRHGGGIHVEDGTAVFNHSTLVLNSADVDEDGDGFAGGIFSDPKGSVTIGHTILAQNANLEPFLFKWEDCHGKVDGTGWNLIYDANLCVVSASNSLIGASPELGTFDNHGGPTKTYSLSPNSWAIDNGNPDNCKIDNAISFPIDQRWFERLADGNSDNNKRCDIGAFEYNSVPLVIDCSAKPGSISYSTPSDQTKLKGAQVSISVNSTCADTYRVVIRQGAKNGPVVDKVKGLAIGMYLTAKLQKGQTYYWRATACNAAGCTKGPWQSFFIKP